MVYLCLLLVPLAMAISLPLTALLIRWAYRKGRLDQPDDPAIGGRKWHAQATPNVGGMAIFWAILLPMLAVFLAVRLVPDSSWPGIYLAPVIEHLAGLRVQTMPALALLGGLAAVHLMGVIDDRLRLGPLLKLSIQLGVALLLAWPMSIRALDCLANWYGLAGLILSILISVFWMVGICNAMNFMDNMDGLSGGVGAVIAAVYLAINLLGGQWFVAALSALLLGSLLGFLVFNVHRARIFMGDGGSLVIGLLLAVISIRTTYVGPAGLSDAWLPAGHWYGALTPLVVMAVPLYDLTSVTLIRLSQGKSPFVGDRNHFSHRLVRLGLSQPAAVALIWLIALTTGLSGLLMPHLHGWQAILVAVQTLGTLAVLAILERSGLALAKNEPKP